MKKMYLLPIAALVTALVFTACIKHDDVTQCTSNTLAQDQHVIDSFITNTGASYISYSTNYGAYAGISYEGNGDKAVSTSQVAFTRTISLLNGTVLAKDSLYRNSTTGNNYKSSDFTTTSPIYLLLNNAKLGGNLKMIYPSSTNVLGYWACEKQTLNDGTVIPAYSQLIFDYTLTGIKN